jgi:hypothetical protein
MKKEEVFTFVNTKTFEQFKMVLDKIGKPTKIKSLRRTYSYYKADMCVGIKDGSLISKALNGLYDFKIEIISFKEWVYEIEGTIQVHTKTIGEFIQVIKSIGNKACYDNLLTLFNSYKEPISIHLLSGSIIFIDNINKDLVISFEEWDSLFNDNDGSQLKMVIDDDISVDKDESNLLLQKHILELEYENSKLRLENFKFKNPLL